jgi:uncharacterized peroxidase-related enzyme
MAMAHGFTREEVRHILDDVDRTTLVDEKTRALLRFSRALTSNPYTIGEEDIQALRSLDLSDEEILEAIHVIAFFNSMDRMADATGAPVENLQDAMVRSA